MPSTVIVEEPSGAVVPFRAPRRPNPVMSVPRGITPEGEAFLKDAFAPPDFQHIDVRGVPDEFNGRTLVRQHVLTMPSVQLGSSNTIGELLVFLPTPGIACWRGHVTGSIPPGPGFTLFPYLFPDSLQLFPPQTTTGPNVPSNFSDFRYLSGAIEVISNDPVLTVQGSINVIKTRISLTKDNDGNILITGDEGFAAVFNRSEYSGKYSDGAYSVALNTQPDWEFTPMLSRTTSESAGKYDDVKGTGGYTFSASTGSAPTDPSFPILGVGSLEAIVIWIQAPAAIGSDWFRTLRVWQTVEYKVQPQSLLYPSAISSPPYDPMALAAYRAMTQLVPVAVIVAQNANFWTRLLGFLGKGLSAIGLAFPGPWGAAATAAGAGASWIANRYK